MPSRRGIDKQVPVRRRPLQRLRVQVVAPRPRRPPLVVAVDGPRPVLLPVGAAARVVEEEKGRGDHGHADEEAALFGWKGLKLVSSIFESRSLGW